MRPDTSGRGGFLAHVYIVVDDYAKSRTGASSCFSTLRATGGICWDRGSTRETPRSARSPCAR